MADHLTREREEGCEVVTSIYRRRLDVRKQRTAARMTAHANEHGLSVADLNDVRLPWYRMSNLDGDGADGAAELLIYEEIGGSFGIGAEQFAIDLAQITAPTIRVRINSPGGSVFDGIAIYNSLNHHPAHIVVYVDSLAASIASVIAMAGDEIVMMPGSQMMIHDASSTMDGPAADMTKMATLLDRQSDNLADIYRMRGGGDVSRWRDLMLAETWMFADEAVDMGLADRVAVPPRKTSDTPAPAGDESVMDSEGRALMSRSFDLDGFRYHGRAAAPAPRTAARMPHGDSRMKARVTPPVGTHVDTDRVRAAVRPPRDCLYRAVYPGIEIRSGDSDAMPHLVGHFAVFNQWTEIDSVYEGHFLERIAPGAFRKTFAESRDSIRVLFQHGRDPQIGDKPLGSIVELAEDGFGALYDVDLLDVPYNQNIIPGLRAGLYGSSFRFRVTREEFVRAPKSSAHNPDGLPERTIQEASVSEFGPVTFPAYSGATAGIRSLTDDFLIDSFTRSPDRLRELMQHLQVPASAPLDDAGLTTSSGRREPSESRPLVVIRNPSKTRSDK